MMERVVVSVVGTSGRKQDAVRMTTPELFRLMTARVAEIVTKELDLEWSRVLLQSGGAPWSDHVAVQLFLEHEKEGAKLRLYLPCALLIDDAAGPARFSESTRAGKMNPGALLNRLHGQFSRMLGRSALDDIKRACALGAVVDTEGAGFWQRNTMISKCDVLLAFTWSEGDVPSSAGTLDTWRKCKAPRKMLLRLAQLSPADSKRRERGEEAEVAKRPRYESRETGEARGDK